jgi:hypothetical protein
MNSVVQVRGSDERMHIFRLERPSLYAHYARPVWGHLADEVRVDDREYTRSEVIAWVEAQYPLDPISPGEIENLTKSIPKNWNGGWKK